MKKILVLCLLIIFAMGNMCFAQSAAGDQHTYGVDRAPDGLNNPQELCKRHHCRHRHQHRHHHRQHHDDGDLAEDIVKGAIIIGIAHEIFD